MQFKQSKADSTTSQVLDNLQDSLYLSSRDILAFYTT